MPKTKKVEKHRFMLVGGPSDNRIMDYEHPVGAPPRLLFVSIPPSDVSEIEEQCRWQVGTYGFKSSVDFEEMGVHYTYEWVGIIE